MSVEDVRRLLLLGEFVEDCTPTLAPGVLRSPTGALISSAANLRLAALAVAAVDDAPAQVLPGDPVDVVVDGRIVARVRAGANDVRLPAGPNLSIDTGGRW